MKASLKARACAAVFMGLSKDERRTLVEIARANYRLDLDCSAVAVAVLVHEAEDPTGRLHDVVNRLSTDMSTGPHAERGDMVELPALVTALVLRQESGIYGDGFAAFEARIAREARKIIDVVTSKVLPPEVGLVRTSWQMFDNEVAAIERALAPTDIPPAGDLSEGQLEADKVLAREDALHFMQLLHEYEVDLLEQARRAEEQRDAAASTDVRFAASLKAVNHRDIANAIRGVRLLFVRAAPELQEANDSLNQAAALQARSETGTAQSFAWGAPSVHGLIPHVFDEQDALELHVAIPSGAEIHPLYNTPGREIDDRVGALIMRLVDKNRSATHARIRIDLCAEASPPGRQLAKIPLASETTASHLLGTIPCPFCGCAEPISNGVEAPALSAGDPVEHVCSNCGEASTKRFEQRTIVYLRPGFGRSGAKDDKA